MIISNNKQLMYYENDHFIHLMVKTIIKTITKTFEQ